MGDGPDLHQFYPGGAVKQVYDMVIDLTAVVAGITGGGGGTTGATGPTGHAGNDGAAGATGPTGLGATGPTGSTGAAGAQGLNGTQGPPGNDGSDGADGADSVVPGPPGLAGATGSTGPTGATGATGAAGGAGGVGATGPTGTVGTQGPPGNDGSDGADGADSVVPGPIGVTGATGATGPSSAAGPTGAVQFALDGTGAYGATGTFMWDQATGTLVRGWTAPITVNVGVVPVIQNHQFANSAIATMRWSNDIGAAQFLAVKSRALTPGTHVTTVSGDVIGNYQFYADEGTNYTISAAIRVEVDGTPSAGAMFGRILFLTNNGAGAVSEAMRVSADKGVSVGITPSCGQGSVNAGNGFYVNGCNVIAPGRQGDDGSDGEDSYVPGPVGATGATGPTGSTGVTGPAGTALASRATTTLTKTSDVAFADVVGLSVNLAAGQAYIIEAECFVTYTTSAGGWKFILNGTATITSLTADISEASQNNAAALTPFSSRVVAFSSTVGHTVTTASATGGIIRITGLIVVNAAGTLKVQFAQNASSASASACIAGSWLRCTPVV